MSGFTTGNTQRENYRKRMPRIKAMLVVETVAYVLRHFARTIRINFWKRILPGSAVAFLILASIPDFGMKFQKAATRFPLTYFCSWLTVKSGRIKSMDDVIVSRPGAWVLGILSLPVCLILLALFFDIINAILTVIGNIFASYAYTEKTKDLMRKEGLPHLSREAAARQRRFLQEEKERNVIFAFKKDPLNNYHPEG